MDHRFNVEIAVKYGVHEALLIMYIHHWMSANRQAERFDHYIDGRWWTYSTVKQLTEVFPYFTKPVLYRILTKLTKQGVVISARYNKSNINQTRWYSLNDEVTKILDEAEFAKSQNGQTPNLRNREIEFTKSQNRIYEIVKSHNTVNKTTVDKTTVNKASNAGAREGFQPGPDRATAETTQAFLNFECRFGGMGPSIVERIGTLLEEYGDEIYARAWEKLKAATPAITNPNRGIKYLETTCLGLAAGNDYSKSRNDVANAARVVEENLAREVENENGTNTSDSVWGVWEG